MTLPGQDVGVGPITYGATLLGIARRHDDYAALRFRCGQRRRGAGLLRDPVGGHLVGGARHSERGSAGQGERLDPWACDASGGDGREAGAGVGSRDGADRLSEADDGGALHDDGGPRSPGERADRELDDLLERARRHAGAVGVHDQGLDEPPGVGAVVAAAAAGVPSALRPARR